MFDVIKLVSLVLLDYFLSANSPIVEIKNGSLQGSVMSARNGREFFAYRGIPFALPPVGQLRFEVKISILRKKWNTNEKIKY